MRVSRLDSGADWTFGKGKANYVTNSNAVAQNVTTRLRMFRNDWYLDIELGIDWIGLLGRPNTERRILRAIEATVLQTEGVIAMSGLEIVRRDGRDIAITFSIETATGEKITIEPYTIFSGNPILPPEGAALFLTADGATFWTAENTLFTVPSP